MKTGLIVAVGVGHIPGTSQRDLSRIDEKGRDLSRRSDDMHGAFAMVREALVQDPGPTGRLVQAVASLSPGNCERQRSASIFRHHRLVEAPEYYEELANQDLDRTLHTDDLSSRAEDIALAQVHALLALASALDRLATATQAQR
jgi:hypothetical protein